MNRYILTFLITLSFVSPSWADTIAASCSVGDIDSAIDAVAEGGTVRVPSGTCNYPVLMTSNIVNSGGLCRVTTTAAHGLSSGAYVQLSSGSGVSGCGTWPIAPKKITVINTTTFDMLNTSPSGTYSTSVGVAPRIRMSDKSVSVIGGYGGTTNLTGRPIISIGSTSGSKALRFSGFSIDYSYTANETAPFTISTDNNSTFRVDNNYIATDTRSNAINIYGSFGVVDNNYFIGDQTKIIVYGKNGASTTTPEWMSTAEFGTNKFAFIENDTFVSNYRAKSWAAVKTNYGGRAVVRYNSMINQTFVQHGAIGISASFEGRSGRAAEVYGNSFYCPFSPARVYPYTDSCFAWLEYFGGSGLAYSNTSSGDWALGFNFMVQRVSDTSSAGGAPWGLCDGTTSKTWDGNTSPAGYVCHDQTGAGVDSVMTNVNPPPQSISEPLHYWGNTGSATSMWVQSTHLQNNREYCTHDTSTACGSITTSYTPYEYPHPLVGGGLPGGDSTPNPFSFTDISGATRSTQYTSNTITLGGLDTAATVTVSGGTYSKNGGAYTSSSGTAELGDTFNVRHTSSGSYSTTTSTTLTIGGVSDTYSVQTLSDPGISSPPKLRGWGKGGRFK